MDQELRQLLNKLESLVDDLRVYLPKTVSIEWEHTFAAKWRSHETYSTFHPIKNLETYDLDDLLEIDRHKTSLINNTELFCRGLPANNALLWGARGTGKSSLVHAILQNYHTQGLRLVEVEKHYLAEIGILAEILGDLPYKFIIFCDDLSFDEFDFSYKDLKSALEGSLVTATTNILLYVTSNRRHLITELHRDNEGMGQQDLHEAEAIEEKISLSDRFGLWLAFHPFDQEQYLRVVNHWIQKLASQYQLDSDMTADTKKEALQWALNRGVRSGRTAAHFAQHWIGKKLLEQTE
ncbi:MAG: ATP-binding protein [Gammaproteobacteria bacterium]|nr:ATP-binding protein [Gammaproteobacteria bacterium]